jgi:hypothetical protein
MYNSGSIIFRDKLGMKTIWRRQIRRVNNQSLIRLDWGPGINIYRRRFSFRNPMRTVPLPLYVGEPLKAFRLGQGMVTL